MSPSSIPTMEEEYAAQLRDLEEVSADMKECEAMSEEAQKLMVHVEAGMEAFRALDAMSQYCSKANNVVGMRQLVCIFAQLSTHMLPTLQSLESLQIACREIAVNGRSNSHSDM
ncbi:hypothetical protein E4U59_006272 [Claviceps monticola]|nr:hypothetical protein E4U59_006272 [Claviceps monticola]